MAPSDRNKLLHVASTLPRDVAWGSRHPHCLAYMVMSYHREEPRFLWLQRAYRASYPIRQTGLSRTQSELDD